MMILIIAGIVIILIVVRLLLKVPHPVSKTFLGMLIGIMCLGAVNLTGGFTGVHIPVSVLSLGISAVAGIPGVTMMVLLNLIL